MSSMAAILQARFNAIPRSADNYCFVTQLDEFLSTCRKLCAVSAYEDPRSCDSTIFFSFDDGSRLDVENPKQTVYPALAKVNSP